jgi:uncharacterized phosphosugar-binding protein
LLRTSELIVNGVQIVGRVSGEIKIHIEEKPARLVDSEELEELEQKAKVLEQHSHNNQDVITVLLESGKNKLKP